MDRRKNTTVILIGTTHETPEEDSIFKKLNMITKKNSVTDSVQVHWLCEGESDMRNCHSLKSYDLHLLTDSLFLVIMLRNFYDFNNTPFMNDLYNRFIELLITLSRTNQNVSHLVNHQYYQYVEILKPIRSIRQSTLKDIELDIRKIPVKQFVSDVIDMTIKIIKYSIDKNLVEPKYHACIKMLLNIYGTDKERSVTMCENLLLMKLRDESFNQIFNAYTNNLSDGKHYVVMTVGKDHVRPLKKLMQNSYKVLQFMA